jgi:hypothetical protein
VRPSEEPHVWVPVFKGTESQCRRFARHMREGGITTRVVKKTGFHLVCAKQFKQPKFREGLKP